MHDSSHLALIFLHIAFIKLTISEKDLDDSILELPTLKTSFDYLIWLTK